MNIRTATKRDRDILCELIISLFLIEEDFTVNSEKQLRGIDMLLADNRSVILVAEEDNRVIGMVTCQLLISTAEGAYSGLVEDMVVHKDFRGKGIGTKLIEASIAWAKSQGATRVQLLADRTNSRALDFYNKNGWSETKMFALRHY